MICTQCGTQTTKQLDIQGGQQVAIHECSSCGYTMGKEIIASRGNTSFKGNTGMVQSKGLVARIVDKATSLHFDKYTPLQWFTRQNVVPKEITPPDSGVGYIFSPYTSLWTMMWGVTPIADLSKYRLMYRTVPKIKRGIDKTVSSAIIKGFNRLEITEQVYPPEGVSDEDYKAEVIAYVEAWMDAQDNFTQVLSMVAADMLIYGNAFVELVYSDIILEEEQSQYLERYQIHKTDYDWAGKGLLDMVRSDPLTTVDNPGGKYTLASAKGDLLWLKPLDPLYMRVRADAYGNIFGYLQFLQIPPVAYTPEKMAHFRFNPKSWNYEQVYGVSLLMSLIRTQDIIYQIENDLILLGHATIKPPILFKCGTAEQPWTEPMFNAFIASSSSRSAGGDIYTRGDVEATPLPAPAESIASMVTYLDYHDTQRTIAMGVPPQLLGEPEGSSRTTAEVSLDDWVNTLQILQQEISNTLEDQIFKYVVQNKFGPDAPTPRPIWNELFDKNEDSIVSRIVSMKAAGIITLNEARNWLSELNVSLSGIEGGDRMHELEMLEVQVEQMEQQATVPEVAGVSNNTFPNLEQPDQRKERTVPLGGVERLASRYKEYKIGDMDGMAIFKVSDKDIKLDLDSEWPGMGTSDTHDFIDEGEIWLSKVMADVGDTGGVDQLMYPGLPKRKEK